MRNPYSQDYAPPMPILKIRLSFPGQAPITDELTAIVDTGSDGTIAPPRFIAPFRSDETDRTWLVSPWGERRLEMVYVLDIHIGSLCLPSVRVVKDSRGKELILGRDVLNKLRVLLDGPAQTTEILEPKSKRK
ncbi:MAG: hypothetical protein FJ009_21570 [Chloroflexi bacterium]|nr:hypothetical protein [Chloroflexota bacterium]